MGKRIEIPWDFLGVVKLSMPDSYTSSAEGVDKHEVIKNKIKC